MSAIQDADWIFVVKDGAVIEQGRHSDLVSKEGAYYSLVTSQILK